MLIPRIVLIVACLFPAVGGRAAETVQTKAKPSDKRWREQSTRTLGDLAGFAPSTPVALSPWGGWAGERREATGAFRVHREPGGRWWLVDPDGHLFLHVGLAGVYRGVDGPGRETTAKTFPNVDAWADFTLGLMRENRFNGLGGWTEAESVRGRANSLPYSVSLNFTADFGRELGLTRVDPGNTGYAGEVPPFLHPDFPVWCDRYAEKNAAPLAGDRMLLGFFSDNELPLRRELLQNSLRLDEDRVASLPMRRAAEAWLRERRGAGAFLDPATVTDEEQIAFLGHVCEVYYGTVAAALRKHAPGHLYLGSRVHGRSTRFPEVFRAAGRHVDVVSVNYYNAWTPDRERVAMWTAESGRPVIITEFYAKGEDTGMENESGAGWLVKTQRDRGLFYQNFVLGLLESGTVVGWHWFKYRDNEPWTTETDPSNRNSNKGVVSWDYKPFGPLLERMRELNAQVYPLTRYFDARAGAKTASTAP